MRALDLLLERIGCYRLGAQQGCYIARCPAHDDHSPSLSIRETEDGTVLLHCFAGCAVNDIVDALGLKITDLFPATTNPNGHRGERAPFPAAAVLSALAHEATVVLCAAGALKNRQALPEEDIERLSLAYQRIAAALEYAGIGRHGR